MKNILLILLVASSVISSCKRTDWNVEGYPIEPSKLFVGTWDLVEINGSVGDYGYFISESKSLTEAEISFHLSDSTHLSGGFGGGYFGECCGYKLSMWNMVYKYTTNGQSHTTQLSVDWSTAEWTETGFTCTAQKNATVIDGSSTPISAGTIWKFKKRSKK